MPALVCAVDRLSRGHWQDQDKEVSFSYHYIFYLIYYNFQYVVLFGSFSDVCSASLEFVYANTYSDIINFPNV